MTQIKEKTSREASERNYEVYNRNNLLAITEPLDKAFAIEFLAALHKGHTTLFPWHEGMTQLMEKGFPFAIRMVGSKGRRSSRKNELAWIKFWVHGTAFWDNIHALDPPKEDADFLKKEFGFFEELKEISSVLVECYDEDKVPQELRQYVV